MATYSIKKRIICLLVIVGAVSTKPQNEADTVTSGISSNQNNAGNSQLQLNDEDMQLLNSYFSGGTIPENVQITTSYQNGENLPTENQGFHNFIQSNETSGQTTNGGHQVYILQHPGQEKSGQGGFNINLPGQGQGMQTGKQAAEQLLQLSGANRPSSGQNMMLLQDQNGMGLGQNFQFSQPGQHLQLSNVDGRLSGQNGLGSAQNLLLSQQTGQQTPSKISNTESLQNQFGSGNGRPSGIQLGVTGPSNGRPQPAKITSNYQAGIQGPRRPPPRPQRQPLQRAQSDDEIFVDDSQIQEQQIDGAGWYEGQNNNNGGRLSQSRPNYQQQYQMYGQGDYMQSPPQPFVHQPVYYVQQPVIVPPIFMGHPPPPLPPHFLMKGPMRKHPHHRLKAMLYGGVPNRPRVTGNQYYPMSQGNLRPSQNIQVSSGRPNTYTQSLPILNTSSGKGNMITSPSMNSAVKPNVQETNPPLTVQNVEKPSTTSSTKAPSTQNNKQVTENTNIKENIQPSGTQKIDPDSLNLNLETAKSPTGITGQLQSNNTVPSVTTSGIAANTTRANFNPNFERNGIPDDVQISSGGGKENTVGGSVGTGGTASKLNTYTAPAGGANMKVDGAGMSNGGKLNIPTNGGGGLQTIHIIKQFPGGMSYNGNTGKNGNFMLSNGQTQNGGNENRGSNIRVVTMPQQSNIKTIKLISQQNGAQGGGMSGQSEGIRNMNNKGNAEANERNIGTNQGGINVNGGNNGKLSTQTKQSDGQNGMSFTVQPKETDNLNEVKYTQGSTIKGSNNNIESAVSKFQMIPPASKFKQIKFHPNSFLITPIKNNQILTDED